MPKKSLILPLLPLGIQDMPIISRDSETPKFRKSSRRCKALPDVWLSKENRFPLPERQLTVKLSIWQTCKTKTSWYSPGRRLIPPALKNSIISDALIPLIKPRDLKLLALLWTGTRTEPPLWQGNTNSRGLTCHIATPMLATLPSTVITVLAIYRV